MEGWIKLHRRLSKNPLWLSQPFTDGQAWVDLIMIANHDDGMINVRGVRLEVKRGQIGWSEMKLADRWKWSRGKVRRFLSWLEDENMIKVVQQNNKITNLISIINYNEYQEGGTTDGQQTVQQTDNKRTTDGQQTDTNKNVKKNKNEKNEKNEKKKSPTASRSVSNNDYIDQVVDQFSSAHGDYEIVARGKERAAAGRLVKKYREKFPDANSQETVQGLRDYFDKCVKIQDDWYRQNMSLSLIISKFNEINKILKNGSSKGKRNSISEDYKKGLLEKMLS